MARAQEPAPKPTAASIASELSPADKAFAEIRTVTGQYAVPAADDEEGATLDWMKVVLPVGLATLGVFAVSLVLMRMWHKIDPS